MDATGVSHIAICVRDLDKSLEFYRDVLGMRVTFDEVQDTTTGGLPYTYKHPRKTRRTVHVRYGEGRTAPSLVLTSHPGDQSDGEPIMLDQVGISHLSFTVRDLKGLARRAAFDALNGLEDFFVAERSESLRDIRFPFEDRELRCVLDNLEIPPKFSYSRLHSCPTVRQ